MIKKKKLLVRKILINRKTGQASITLPNKKLIKLFKRMPKKIKLEIKGVGW